MNLSWPPIERKPLAPYGRNLTWVGVDDVAAHLGVGKDSIYRWVENRGLPARKVGRLLRFRLSEVDAWVEAGEGERPAEPPPPAPAPRRGGRRKQKDGGR